MYHDELSPRQRAGMVEDLAYRQGSFCQIYGHHWTTTSITGQYTCSRCRKTGYCPECFRASIRTFPRDGVTVRCTGHSTHSIGRRT